MPQGDRSRKVTSRRSSGRWRRSGSSLPLAFLSECAQATALAIQTACRMTLGEVRSRLAHLESLRHVTSRQDMRLVPPARVFLIISEGRRRIEC